MRNTPSGLRDRVLAAIEIPVLGIWLGALVGFAFVSAPLAFRIVAPLDVARFAALTAQTIATLTVWGYVLGGIAIVAAILARSRDSSLFVGCRAPPIAVTTRSNCRKVLLRVR